MHKNAFLAIIVLILALYYILRLFYVYCEKIQYDFFIIPSFLLLLTSSNLGVGKKKYRYRTEKVK